MAETLVRYEPRGAARELFSCRASEVVISGPAGTGKSLAALYRLHFACLATPGVRCLIVRKTAVSLGSTTLVTFDEKVAVDALRVGVVSFFGGSVREASAYRYSNGSTIVVGGMDKPEKILSSEYDLVFADEAIELTETDWETISTRLRHGVLGWQQQIAACNPSYPHHWLKRRLEKAGVVSLSSRHADNPAFVNADGTKTPAGIDYLGKLDALTGVRRLRLRDGLWSAAEGVIFEQFDDAVHLVDAFPVPADWTRWWAVDFGFTNPLVCSMWAEDPDGRLFLYREVYFTRRTVDDHARRILATVSTVDKAGHRTWTERKPRAIVCDHDAEGRAVLERELGLGTVAAHKKVKEGIQAVQKRLTDRRLFIMRGALVERDPALDDVKKPASTYEEVSGYVWAPGRVSSGATLTPEEPVKENDHGCDAMRYIVAQRDLGSRPRVRWM